MKDSQIDIQYSTGLTRHNIEQALVAAEAVMALPPSPLGLQAFVTNFAEKVRNLTRGLSSGRLRAIQGVAQAIG